MKSKQNELYRLAIEIDSHFATRKEFVDAVNANLTGKDKGVTEQQVSNILHGRNGFGNKMKRRFAAAGIDIEFVETGIKAENDIQTDEGKYNNKTNNTKVVGSQSAMLGEPVADLSFEGEIRIVRTSIEGGVRVQIYEMPSASYRETMRNAEPELTEGQKMPMPLRIEEKPEGVLIKPFEIQGKAAAKPVQPDSRKEYEESL